MFPGNSKLNMSITQVASKPLVIKAMLTEPKATCWKINPSNASKAQGSGVGCAAGLDPPPRRKELLPTALCLWTLAQRSPCRAKATASYRSPVWLCKADLSPARAPGNVGYLTSVLWFLRGLQPPLQRGYIIFPQVQTCVFRETRVGDSFCSICSCLAAFWASSY